MIRALFAALVVGLADSATAEIVIKRAPPPPAPAVVGATGTLTRGAMGCPTLESLLAASIMLRKGDHNSAIKLLDRGHCVRIEAGTTVTVTELSPLGECLKPAGADACLWTLNGSFGD
jgi:hypothetical protein